MKIVVEDLKQKESSIIYKLLTEIFLFVSVENIARTNIQDIYHRRKRTQKKRKKIVNEMVTKGLTVFLHSNSVYERNSIGDL